MIEDEVSALPGDIGNRFPIERGHITEERRRHAWTTLGTAGLRSVV